MIDVIILKDDGTYHRFGGPKPSPILDSSPKSDFALRDRVYNCVRMLQDHLMQYRRREEGWFISKDDINKLSAIIRALRESVDTCGEINE